MWIYERWSSRDLRLELYSGGLRYVARGEERLYLWRDFIAFTVATSMGNVICYILFTANGELRLPNTLARFKDVGDAVRAHVPPVS